MTFVYYLMIGTLFTLIVDILANYLETDKRLNNLERIVVIILWPFSLFVFLRELWRARNGEL